jgi:hypothetical protein
LELERVTDQIAETRGQQLFFAARSRLWTGHLIFIQRKEKQSNFMFIHTVNLGTGPKTRPRKMWV